MIRKIIATWLLVHLAVELQAQPYGNEWINYAQPYYKIKIAQNGIYRIDSATLASAGIPVVSIDPRNLQLFHNGIESYIYVQGESDGRFNTGDYLEFYGEKNDGRLDSLLYVNSYFVPNPYYSLVNDTSAYFLTWNSSTGNRRMQVETDTAFSGYTAAAYFYKEQIQPLSYDYFEGETDAVGGTDSRYTRAEGYFSSSVINLGGSAAYAMLTPKLYATGPSARFQAVVIGASRNTSLFGPEHHVQLKFNGVTLHDTLFTGYEANRFTDLIPASSLNDPASNSLSLISVADPGFTSNRTTLSYFYLSYPHTPDLEGKDRFWMSVPDDGLMPKTFLNMSNFAGSGIVHLYDLRNAKRIDVVQSGSNYKVLIPNGGEKKCYLNSDANAIYISSLVPVTPSGYFTNYAATVPDSAFVIVTHASLATSVAAYNSYRNLSGYGTIQADINQLYDQYIYGIEKNALCIRRFMDQLMDLNLAAPPAYLFLMGKSIHLKDCRTDAVNYFNCLVPSFGNPSSDNLITAGLNGAGLAPAVPTGRLAAKNNTDVDNYLNKVQQFEAAVPDEWMKQVLHFGGGSTAFEQSSFVAYLNNYKHIAEDTLFGAHVTSYYKTSSAPIEINTSDSLRDRINNGVALMTFFGHASGTGFDQSIDDVSTYSPLPGHYPMLLANSCYAGDLHAADNTASGSSLSSSETFVLAQDKGVIAYLGSVGLGIPYALNSFSSAFYQELSRDHYGASVGKLLQLAITDVEPFTTGDTLRREMCYEMTLHGDPALHLHTYPKPDYSISNADVFTDMTTAVDTFTVYAVRTNLGKATSDTIIDRLIRVLPNGDTTSYFLRSAAPRFKDTIAFRVPVDYTNGVGLNNLYIDLDHFAQVDELNEMNNSTGAITVFVNGGDVIPVWPYEFAIVPTDTVTLKASTADLFAASKNYVFQLDTTDTFNSPLLQSTTITSVGGVLRWKPSLTFSDSTVYYWRVSSDSVDTRGFSWRESSFQYVAGKRGWEQAHFFQYKNDPVQFVKFNRPARMFSFANDVKNIQCVDGVPPYLPYDQVVYKVNNYTKYVSSWTLPGMTMVVFDPVSGDPWKNYAQGGGHGMYGSTTGYPAGHAPEEAFDFVENNTADRDTITQFILNTIPNGAYVLAYTQEFNPWAIHAVPGYENSLYNAFDSLGSSQIRTVPAAAPYILFGRKGAPAGSAKELVGSSISSILQLDTTITTNWTDGYIASPVIGPASSWDSLSWRQHSLDGVTTADSIVVRMIGIKADGTETVLANLTTAQHDVANLSTLADAAVFPKMRLVAYMKDDSLHTAPQLDKWQVFYAPVPEAAIDPPLGYSFTNPVLQEGDAIHVVLPVQNISDYAFVQDSLLMNYWIEDQNRVQHALPSKLKKKPFNAGELLLDSIDVNTAGYPGANALWVEVNPVGQTHSQLEQYHFNNIVRIPFTASVDNINPLLDVTFDGVHILNNDIVSAKPSVLIRLKDENQFLALNDTNDFKLFLKVPSSAIAQRIYFGTQLLFYPAVLPNNSCQLLYNPYLTEDGTYQLIVQAKDKSNNNSGAVDYKINFEVINRSTITEVMNYPNPFSTSTRFVFTLTGSEVPTTFKIQIMTITGKVVREIFQDELGPLHIGRNITEYAWDGKDEFGDQLANGVYLYRVSTLLNGESIEKRDSGADQYFKKGWGKMYLLR